MPSKLPEKQQRFVEEYLVDLNAYQAAIRAGYATKSARSRGSRLLAKSNIQEAIQDGIAKRSKRTQIKQDDVLRHLMDVMSQ